MPVGFIAKILLTLVLFALALAFLPASAQTIFNGSFESNSFPNGVGYASQNGGVIAGWTISNPNYIGLNTSAGPFANNGATPDGANVAFIQSYVGLTNSLSTTISNLVPGAAYQVTFRANCRDYQENPNTAAWSINGGAFVPFTAAPPVGGANPYYTNSGSFTATSNTAPLILRNGLPTGDATVLLDDFRIVAIPGFSNVTATATPGLPGTYWSSVAWGDYDNDGRLDFILMGDQINFVPNEDGGYYVPGAQLWRNNGNGTFSNVTASVVPDLPQVGYGSVAWGDFDNDGRLDFLITGWDGGNDYVRLFRNTGSGFTNVTATAAPGLPALEKSSVAWGDYDNDGRLDFLLTGTPGVSQLWHNNGNGTFSNVTATVAPGLPGVYRGSVAWGDYDNDGRLDFLLTGLNGGSEVSQLWRNNGNGTFSNVTATAAPGLPGVYDSSVAWGDYDNDGRLDFLLTGRNGLSGVSQLWRNNGDGTFSDATATAAPGLPGVYFSSVAWGDYDNDGRLDFFLTGGPFVLSQELWRNNGDGTFSDVTATIAPGLPGVSSSSVVWADYDNDGRLDFLLTGFVGGFGGGPNSQLWRNTTPAGNAPPSAPTGLLMTATTNAVMFSWNSATDDHTPATGLSYNVRAGSTPGGTNLLAAHVNAATGFRRVPTMGNAVLRHTLPLTGLTNGQPVYWSVQAVDTAFAGGPFASETSVVTIPTLTITPSTATNAIVSWTPPTWGWVLEETPSLNPVTWSNSPSGDLNPASVSRANDATFYRLRRP